MYWQLAALLAGAIFLFVLFFIPNHDLATAMGILLLSELTAVLIWTLKLERKKSELEENLKNQKTYNYIKDSTIS